MIFEGEIDSVDGIAVHRDALNVARYGEQSPKLKSAWALRAFKPEPDRWVGINAMVEVADDFPAFKPGDRIRITVEKIQ